MVGKRFKEELKGEKTFLKVFCCFFGEENEVLNLLVQSVEVFFAMLKFLGRRF